MNLTTSQMVGSRANALAVVGDVNILLWFLCLTEGLSFLSVLAGLLSSQQLSWEYRGRGDLFGWVHGSLFYSVFLVSWRLLQEDKKQISFKEISLPLNILGRNPYSAFTPSNFSLAPFLPVHIYYFCELQPHEDSKRLNYLPKLTVRKRKLRLFHLNLSGSGILCRPPPPPTPHLSHRSGFVLKVIISWFLKDPKSYWAAK